MKSTVTQYAQALLEVTRDKSEADVARAVERFFAIVQEDGRVRDIPKIIERFERMYNEEHSIVAATVVLRQEAPSLALEVKEFLGGASGARKVELTTRIDTSIIGGARIELPHERIDITVRRQLRELGKVLGR